MKILLALCHYDGDNPMIGELLMMLPGMAFLAYIHSLPYLNGYGIAGAACLGLIMGISLTLVIWARLSSPIEWPQEEKGK
jgi:hypothetical protein